MSNLFCLVEPLYDLLYLGFYFLAWVCLIPAAIFLVFGLRNRSGLTFAIGGGFLIVSVTCFYLTGNFYHEHNNGEISKNQQEMQHIRAHIDSVEKAKAVRAKRIYPEDTAIFHATIGEFKLTVEYLLAYPDKQGPDTLFFDGDLNSTIEGQLLKLSSTSLSNLGIDYCFQTSAGISGEGPHCDFYDWKHYTSAYSTLLKSEGGFFLGPSFSEDDRHRKMEASVDELKAYAKKTCPEFAALVKDVNELGKYPSFIALSHVFLRLSGVDSRGIKHYKFVCFRIPMGC